VKAKVLEERGALNGGHCEDYMAELSHSRVEGERVSSRFDALKSSVLLRGFAENGSVIPGAADKRAMLAKMSPSNLPGMLTLFAPAVSCLAQDGDAGGHSPFVGALLSWFGDVKLAKSGVLDCAVRDHVHHMAQTASKFEQKPEWNHSGKIAFRFLEATQEKQLIERDG